MIGPKRILCANWKMHKTLAESIHWVKEVELFLQSPEAQPCLTNFDILVAPTATALYAVAQNIKNLKLASQNVFWQNQGPFTGEISPLQLVDSGCHYVILGHAERRQLWGETSTQIAHKAQASMLAGLHPIICIGDKETEVSASYNILTPQLLPWLNLFRALPKPGSWTVAYEPLWAIGQSHAADPLYVEQLHLKLTSFFNDQLPVGLPRPNIIYGGSVKANSIASFLAQPHINGVIIGNASLEAKEFIEIIRYLA